MPASPPSCGHASSSPSRAHDHPQPGTGIGLSLVRRFAQLQGGDAWVEEGRSGGTRVVVVLQDVGVPEVEAGRLVTT